MVGGTLRSLRFLSAQHVARSRVRGQESCGGKGAHRSHGLGAARDKWVERSGAGACRTAAPRERMALAVAAPAPAGRCRACPEKVCCATPAHSGSGSARRWWPGLVRSPNPAARASGVPTPNHNQPAPTPSNHSQDLWPPGDLLLLLTRTILSTEEPLRAGHFLLHQFLSHFLP